MPQYGKRTQFVREYFVEFEAAFGDDPLVGAKVLAKRCDFLPSPASGAGGEGEGRFRKFTREQIAARDDSPDIAWIKDDSDTSADELPEPAVLAQEAMDELEAVLDELRGILEELGEDVAGVEA
jgi:type I restriction enzyme M protein